MVDDEEDVANLMQIALEREGYSVKVAHSGKEALKLLSREKMELILLDVMMPMMSGWEVLEAIRGGDPKNKDTPIIMVTVKKEMEDIERGYRLGANDYIAKPFKMETLVKRVKRLLGGEEKAKKMSAPPKPLEVDVFEAIFNKHPDGMIVVGEDETILAINPAGEAITGWKGKEIVGKMNAGELLRCHDTYGNPLITSELLRPLYDPQESLARSEFCITTKEGMEIPVSAEIFRLHKGGLSVVTLRNISKRKLQTSFVD